MEQINDPDLRVIAAILRWFGLCIVIFGSLLVLLLVAIYARMEEFVAWVRKETDKEKDDE